jgi:hypothetical protein
MHLERIIKLQEAGTLFNRLAFTLPLLLCLAWPTAGLAFEDVTTYGATGNGLTDDTNAIQSAINVQGSGGAVYFPPGTYLVSTITIGLNDSIAFFGDGADVSIIKQKPFINSSMIQNSNGMAGNIQFRDLGFDGNKDNQSTWTKAIIELKCVRFKVESCAFVRSKHIAIKLLEVTQEAWILNSSFSEMAEHGGTLGQSTDAIRIISASDPPGDFLVAGNYFHADPPSVHGRSPGGVMINPGVSKNHRIVVRDNVFHGIGQNTDGNRQACIKFYRNDFQSIITGNKFYDTAFRAIIVQCSNDILITDNIIVGESTSMAVGDIEITGRFDSGVLTEQYRAIIARNIIQNMPSCRAVLLNFDEDGKGSEI